VATWEDGPEYAPRERPQYFADAPVAPLEQAPPVARPAVGLPVARPRFDQPAAPVAPLAELVPPPPDERDPNRPFEVVTATLTSESTFGAPAGEGPVDPTRPLGSGWAGTGTVVGVPVSRPAGTPDGFRGVDGPPTLPAQPPQQAQGPQPGAFPHAAPREPYAPYPSPGTPEWFAPPTAAYGEQPRPGRPSARDVFEAATPGLCICLAIGGLIYPLAPVLLVVAVFLAMRVQVAQAAVRMTLRVAAGAVGFFAIVGLYRSVFIGDPWWSFLSSWSVAICWISLAVVLLVVWQALRRSGPPAPPAAPGPWG
jgi:hypothetical protein